MTTLVRVRKSKQRSRKEGKMLYRYRYSVGSPAIDISKKELESIPSVNFHFAPSMDEHDRSVVLNKHSDKISKEGV